MISTRLRNVDVKHDWKPLSEISQNLINAVATSEDARICLHSGVDWAQMRHIIKKAISTRSPPDRGGSTISMQVAKNLFLWPAPSYVRKVFEIPLAYFINLTWSKKRVMEVYINIAQFGPVTYGAEASARYHFRKSAKNLSKREATLLAASLAKSG